VPDAIGCMENGGGAMDGNAKSLLSALLLALLAGAATTPAASAEGPVCVENATIGELADALAAGRTTSADLVRAYLARIEAYDRGGPLLNAVREINPDALAIAEALDRAKPARRRPLEGIPILIKDNIATGDKQHTTAGSLALADAQAQRDATVARLLREAGAVILGKANLTEFANILAIDMPSGYSSLGGQVKNPFAPQLDRNGIPIVQPGGSSSGSAVAVAAGLAAAAIGTETSGSLLSPANQNGVVTVKPTVGLISRAGIIPIAHSQDTAGPLARTVRDAAILLNVLAQRDAADEATQPLQRPADYTSVLDKDGLRGARIGIPSDPSDIANDVYYRLTPRAAAVMNEAMSALQKAGAALVYANIPTIGWIGGPGTEAAVLNLNPESLTRYQPQRLPVVYLYELKHDLNAYLRDWAKGTSMRAMADIIAFNAAHADRALRFGQDTFLASEATTGGLDAIEYIAARQMDIRATRTLGIDAYMDEHKLDAILFPGRAGAAIAAKAGYPSVLVPAGMIGGIGGIGGRDTPEYPFGVTFTGRAWSEPTLLRLAYAFEQSTKARRVPPLVPPLVPECAGDAAATPGK
jgi:amidase